MRPESKSSRTWKRSAAPPNMGIPTEACSVRAYGPGARWAPGRQPSAGIKSNKRAVRKSRTGSELLDGECRRLALNGWRRFCVPFGLRDQPTLDRWLRPISPRGLISTGGDLAPFVGCQSPVPFWRPFMYRREIATWKVGERRCRLLSFVRWDLEKSEFGSSVTVSQEEGRLEGGLFRFKWKAPAH